MNTEQPVKQEAALYGQAILRSLDQVMVCLEGLDEQQLNWHPPAEGANSVYGIANHVLASAERNLLTFLTKGSKGVRMRIWTAARLERHQGERRRPVITRTRIKLAGILFMLALPLTGVLLISIASGGATSLASTHLLHGYAVTVVSAAKSQVGARYASVGDTPQTGFSCVGLVHWAYARAGLTVPESAPAIAARYPHVGGATPAGAQLLPGDIVLFVDTAWAGYSHAAIYVGKDMMVSADSPQTGVQLEPLNTPYWDSHWAGAARVPGLIQNGSGSTTPSTPPPAVHPLGQATGDTGLPRVGRTPQSKASKLVHCSVH